MILTTASNTSRDLFYDFNFAINTAREMALWTNVRRRIRRTVEACLLKKDKSEKVHEGWEKRMKNNKVAANDGNSWPETTESLWVRIKRRAEDTFGRFRWSKKQLLEKSTARPAGPFRDSCVPDETCARVRGIADFMSSKTTSSESMIDLYRARIHERVSWVRPQAVRTASGPTNEMYIRQIGKPDVRLDVEGDGNCFYRCVSLWLTGSEDAHLRLRLFLYKVICPWWFVRKRARLAKISSR